MKFLRQLWQEWQESSVPMQAAALAYYTIFSLAPLLLIIIGVAGLVFDQATVRTALLEQFQSLVGDEGSRLLGTMLEGANREGSGVFTSLIGVGTLIFGATGVLAQLQQSLNSIWKVPPRQGVGALGGLLKARLLSFGLILAFGFLVIVLLIVNAVITALSSRLELFGWVWQWLTSLVGFLAITVIFAAIYKYLPDTRVAWRHVRLGALLTALLFMLGKSLIGFYLGRFGVSSSFGAAASLIVLLLWVFYSAQIALTGAVFTHLWSQRREQ
ncbi:MAG: YihY/virulence factor BrkB family protein [Trueperaceae bacterium]